jgi:hypothetical protein
MDRLPTINRTEVAWGVYFVGAVLAVFSAAVAIGYALTALPLAWGAAVAFVLLGLVVALLAPEVRAFWSRLPR